MPVGDGVHGARCPTLGAEQVGANARPGPILGQGVEPDVGHAPAVAVQASDRACLVSVADPFCGAARRIPAGPLAGLLTRPDRSARRQDRDRQPAEFDRAAPLKHGPSKRGPAGVGKPLQLAA
jgi:hypothetical protein